MIQTVLNTLSQHLVSVAQTPHLFMAEKCRRDFFFFVKEFWGTIIEDDPIFNWHIEYLCKELQKVAYLVMAGLPKEYDLVINIPPGTTKSTIITQMFPAWCWIAILPKDKFQETYERKKKKIITGNFLRFISASYSSPLSLEHADLCRDIVRSDKYKTYFPEIEIRQDKELKSNYKLNTGGSRFSTSVGGSVTGTHGHFILIDDPVNPKEAMSDVERKAVNNWIDGTLSTRKVNKAVTVTILVMQRLHQQDCTAHLLKKVKKGKKVKHICLPGKLSDKVKPAELKKYYKKGLLDPVRLSEPVLAEMEAELGQYGYAGQVGQNPVPAGAGMFKVDNFQIVDSLPAGVEIVDSIRYWDKAGTEDGGAFTVGVKMHRLSNKQYLVSDVKRDQLRSDKREILIKNTANADGSNVRIKIEQEPGSGGKESAESTIRNLAGFRVSADRPTGDKVRRADPFSVQVNAGNVLLIRADWNDAYKEEHQYFPFSTYKDQVDASSGAFSSLAKCNVIPEGMSLGNISKKSAFRQ